MFILHGRVPFTDAASKVLRSVGASPDSDLDSMGESEFVGHRSALVRTLDS